MPPTPRPKTPLAEFLEKKIQERQVVARPKEQQERQALNYLNSLESLAGEAAKEAKAIAEKIKQRKSKFFRLPRVSARLAALWAARKRGVKLKDELKKRGLRSLKDLHADHKKAIGRAEKLARLLGSFKQNPETIIEELEKVSKSSNPKKAFDDFLDSF